MKRERKGCDSLGGGWIRGCREGLCKVAREILVPCLITQQRRGHLSTANGGSVKSDALNRPRAGANRGVMWGDACCLCDMFKRVYAGLMGKGDHWDLRVNACPCKGDLGGNRHMGCSWNQLFQKINWEIYFFFLMGAQNTWGYLLSQTKGVQEREQNLLFQHQSIL